LQLEESGARQSRLETELAGMRKPDAIALQMALDRQVMAQRKVEETKARALERCNSVFRRRMRRVTKRSSKYSQPIRI
jgi:hypothetical protein